MPSLIKVPGGDARPESSPALTLVVEAQTSGDKCFWVRWGPSSSALDSGGSFLGFSDGPCPLVPTMIGGSAFLSCSFLCVQILSCCRLRSVHPVRSRRRRLQETSERSSRQPAQGQSETDRCVFSILCITKEILQCQSIYFASIDSVNVCLNGG